jgi:hypothetical protein
MLSATNPRSTTCLVHHEVVVVKSETSHRSVRLEITCSGYPERQFFGLRPQLRVLAVVDIGARFETRRRSVLGAPRGWQHSRGHASTSTGAWVASTLRDHLRAVSMQNDVKLQRWVS